MMTIPWSHMRSKQKSDKLENRWKYIRDTQQIRAMQNKINHLVLNIDGIRQPIEKLSIYEIDSWDSKS